MSCLILFSFLNHSDEILISDYRNVNGFERAMEMDDEGEDSQNVASDIDSQVFIAQIKL